ncbi:MAG: PadR family transcriptional regulator [Candidatus Bathyarchaeia archaeon]
MTEEVSKLLSDFSRFYILTILYEGCCNGYDVLSAFNKRVGKKVSPSLVYPFLRQLEQKGFVKHRLEAVGAKEKKVFELTEKGKEFCESLFRRFSGLVAVAIESSLDVCTSCGCKVYQGGYKEQIGGKMRVFCCVHCAESYKKEKGLM